MNVVKSMVMCLLNKNNKDKVNSSIMNTPTNKRPAGTKAGSPLTPTVAVKAPLLLSPLTPDLSGNLEQRLETILKQLLAWYEKWQAAHRRGISLCTSIEAIKRRALDQKEKDKNTDLYPVDELQTHCNNLAVIMTIFEDVISNVKFYEKQLTVLAQAVENKTRIIFKTWEISRFLEVAQALLTACENEFRIKTVVTENIAHGRTKSELAWHSSVWQYPSYLNADVDLLLNYLKIEIS